MCRLVVTLSTDCLPAKRSPWTSALTAAVGDKTCKVNLDDCKVCGSDVVLCQITLNTLVVAHCGRRDISANFMILNK